MILIHLYRWLIKFITHPIQFIKILAKDLERDFFPQIKNQTKFIFVIGLPKSGTTLIEEILSNLGYIDISTSPLRIFDNRNLKNPHDISINMFSRVPKKKYSFLKLHTHYSKDNLEIIFKFKPTVIISKRSLEDALISRYCHIISDKKHRHYNLLKDLDFNEGLKKSILFKNTSDTPVRPLDYFYNWTNDWLKVIKQQNLDFLILDFDEIKKNKFVYIEKILNYLKIDEYSSHEIMNKIEKNLQEIKKNSLGKNFNNYIKPKTFNNKSIEIRSKLDLKEIKNFIEKNLKQNI